MTAPNSDLWENDPHLLTKTPQYDKNVQVGLFERWHAQGLEPGDEALSRVTSTRRAQYAAWYKAQPKAS